MMESLFHVNNDFFFNNEIVRRAVLEHAGGGHKSKTFILLALKRICWEGFVGFAF